MSILTSTHLNSVEVINIAGHNITLSYLKKKGYWIAIKYGDNCEVFTGVTKDDLLKSILSGLNFLN